MTQIIAISGPSGSGKTTLAKRFIKQLPAHISANIISEDDYDRDQSHLDFEQRLLTNYDRPEAYEHELLSKQVEQLKKQQSIDVPHYCFKQHTRLEQTLRVDPSDIVIVEGLMLFADQSLANVFDLKVYIDTPLDICLLRRINRDIKERGRDIENITRQYLAAVRPAYESYILPSSNQAKIKLSDFDDENALLEALLESVNV